MVEYVPAFLFTQFLSTATAAAVCRTWVAALDRDYPGCSNAEAHFRDARVPPRFCDGTVPGSVVRRTYRRLVYREATPGRLSVSCLTALVCRPSEWQAAPRTHTHRGTLTVARVQTKADSFPYDPAVLDVLPKSNHTAWVVGRLAGVHFAVSYPNFVRRVQHVYAIFGQASAVHVTTMDCTEAYVVCDAVGCRSVLITAQPWKRGRVPCHAFLVTLSDDGAPVLRVCSVALRAGEWQFGPEGAVSSLDAAGADLVVQRPWEIPPL